MITVQSVTHVAPGRRTDMASKKSEKPHFETERVKRLMEERGLSQADLAKFMGVHQGQVSNWMSGRNMPNLETLVKMADFFGVSTDYLVGRIGENQAFYNVPELSPDEWEFILSIRDGSLANAFKKLVEELAKREQESEHEGNES